MRHSTRLFFLFLFIIITRPILNQPIIQDRIIDVVIPCHEKDAHILDFVIDGIRKYAQDIRRIIVVSKAQLSQKAEWFDESLYPFTIEDICLEVFKNNIAAANNYKTNPENRLGWIFQQLLKLYAVFVIPSISENILILDADTIFLRNVSFLDNEGYALYDVGSEFYESYFKHAQRVLPDLRKIFPSYSGICHHMLMQKPNLEDLFNKIKKQHPLQQPWQVFCNCLDLNSPFFAFMSEYEIYFNFIFSGNYKVKIRPLRWLNHIEKFDPQLLEMWQAQGFDHVSCHTYLT